MSHGREEETLQPVEKTFLFLFPFQIVHLQETDLKVRPVCIQPTVRGVRKSREISLCPEDLRKVVRVSPEASPLVLIPVMSKLT